MKVLFDQNVPRPLARFLTKHGVTRSAQLGWEELTNGDLIKAAEDSDFEVLVTADGNLGRQQNLEERRLAMMESDRVIVSWGRNMLAHLYHDLSQLVRFRCESLIVCTLLQVWMFEHYACT